MPDSLFEFKCMVCRRLLDGTLIRTYKQENVEVILCPNCFEKIRKFQENAKVHSS